MNTQDTHKQRRQTHTITPENSAFGNEVFFALVVDIDVVHGGVMEEHNDGLEAHDLFDHSVAIGKRVAISPARRAFANGLVELGLQATNKMGEGTIQNKGKPASWPGPRGNGS